MKILHIAFKGIAFLVSLLPFTLLYILSDLLYLFIYYIFRYRRKITFKNLHAAFPEKTTQEIRTIKRKYYRHLSDLIVEVIKIRSMTKRDMIERVKLNNIEIVEELFKKGKSVFVSLGHCGNWEWTGLKIAMASPHKPYAIVKPLSDVFFDRYMTSLRTKSGYNNMIRFKQTFRTLYRLKEQKNIVIIASDQTPSKSEIIYWTRFLNQDTPFFLGLEKMSKSLDMAVLFFDVNRTARGHYSVDIVKITENPKETAEFEIIEKYISLLEESIRKNPYNWLWSHKRWKYKREIN